MTKFAKTELTREEVIAEFAKAGIRVRPINGPQPKIKRIK